MTSTHFRRLCSSGRWVKGRYLLLGFKKNQKNFSRLGITASRRFGPAVSRNRFKRLVREAFRLEGLSQPLDLVVKPRKYAAKATLDEIRHELRALLPQSGTEAGCRSD